VQKRSKSDNWFSVYKIAILYNLAWYQKILLMSLLFSLMVGFGLIMLDPHTLPIKTVRIDGHLINTNPQTLRTMLSKIAKGGFFNIDFTKVRLSILTLPWVKNVQIHKQWPDTLIIQIQEHTVVARWMNKALVNIEGKLFISYPKIRASSDSVNHKFRDLPLFTGPLKSLKDILKRYNQLAPLVSAAGLKIQEFGCNARKAWYMVLNNGMKLKLGRGDNQMRLQRFFKVYQRLVMSYGNWESLLMDLRYTNGIAVRTVLAK